MGTRLCLIGWTIAGVLLIAAHVHAADPPRNARVLPPSSSPPLDQAGADLAAGRLAAARETFEKVAKDSAAAPIARSLALFGLAETALAGNDRAAAVAAWQQLAGDAALPQLYRDIANRRIAEMQRVQKNLPARDPSAYRAQLPALPESAKTLHVSPTGRDDAEGSEARPFLSLARARDAVRAMRKSGDDKLRKGGVRIIIGGGAYPARQTFELAAADSGTAESPIVYQARPGEAPIFDGGMRISTWRPISDAKLRENLDPSVRGRVIEADLKAIGCSDLGDATALRRRPELYCDGIPQTLARWPNEGFVKTGKVLGKDTFKVWNTIEGCKDGRFQYVEDRPSQWTDEPDVRLYGYWFWDWFEEYQKVASINAAARVFTLASPYSNYGYRKNQRYYGVNIFRELDAPGEWYLDRRSGIMYWLPPQGVDPSKAIVTFSVFAKPFVTMDNVQHVVLSGLTFQEARGDGIRMTGGADCLLAGCTVQRLGGDAIIVSGGLRHGIFGCVMQTLGCGGCRVAGGDRKTFTPGGHFVENCTVSDISRYKRTYTPAVLLDGCGNRVAHNLFEHIPSSAMRIEGNDHLIELNHIRNVVEESDDQGGIDMFGNPLYRGVVIRWNRWSDIRGGTECGAAGIRLDDMISGTAIYGNVFERCGAVQFGGVQIHGGKDNLVDGNVFVDCFAGISFSRWPEKRWLEGVQKFLDEASLPAALARYPDLARLTSDANVNHISRNVFVRCRSVLLRDGGIERGVLNTSAAESIDLPALSDQKAVNGNPQLRRILFEAIPVDEIGPYDHPWRKSR